jgi:hypothetical protein
MKLIEHNLCLWRILFDDCSAYLFDNDAIEPKDASDIDLVDVDLAVADRRVVIPFILLEGMPFFVLPVFEPLFFLPFGEYDRAGKPADISP